MCRKQGQLLLNRGNGNGVLWEAVWEWFQEIAMQILWLLLATNGMFFFFLIKKRTKKKSRTTTSSGFQPELRSQPSRLGCSKREGKRMQFYFPCICPANATLCVAGWALLLEGWVLFWLVGRSHGDCVQHCICCFESRFALHRDQFRLHRNRNRWGAYWHPAQDWRRAGCSIDDQWLILACYLLKRAWMQIQQHFRHCIIDSAKLF